MLCRVARWRRSRRGTRKRGTVKRIGRGAQDSSRAQCAGSADHELVHHARLKILHAHRQQNALDRQRVAVAGGRVVRLHAGSSVRVGWRIVNPGFSNSFSFSPLRFDGGFRATAKFSREVLNHRQLVPALIVLVQLCTIRCRSSRLALSRNVAMDRLPRARHESRAALGPRAGGASGALRVAAHDLRTVQNVHMHAGRPLR